MGDYRIQHFGRHSDAGVAGAGIVAEFVERVQVVAGVLLLQLGDVLGGCC